MAVAVRRATGSTESAGSKPDGFFFFFNAGSSMIASAAAVSARTVLSLLYDAFRHPVRAEWSAVDCVSQEWRAMNV